MNLLITHPHLFPILYAYVKYIQTYAFDFHYINDDLPYKVVIYRAGVNITNGFLNNRMCNAL